MDGPSPTGLDLALDQEGNREAEQNQRFWERERDHHRGPNVARSGWVAGHAGVDGLARTTAHGGEANGQTGCESDESLVAGGADVSVGCECSAGEQDMATMAERVVLNSS